MILNDASSGFYLSIVAVAIYCHEKSLIDIVTAKKLYYLKTSRNLSSLL